jgi:hypothetical protein
MLPKLKPNAEAKANSVISLPSLKAQPQIWAIRQFAGPQSLVRSVINFLPEDRQCTTNVE